MLIDIGNTRAKYCIINEGERGAQQSIVNENLCDDFLNANFATAEKLVVASVSHYSLTDKINVWCQKQQIIYQHVVSERKKNGVVNAYQVAAQLGVDRWLALIGAAVLFPQKNVLIIDTGTATTIDLLAANSQHQGGWIFAGVKTLTTSVLANTAQVNSNRQEAASLVFGDNTSANVHNGAWAATVGAVNLALCQAKTKGIIVDEVIITGGNADMLSSLLSTQNTVIETLVTTGLQAYI